MIIAAIDCFVYIVSIKLNNSACLAISNFFSQIFHVTLQCDGECMGGGPLSDGQSDTAYCKVSELWGSVLARIEPP